MFNIKHNNINPIFIVAWLKCCLLKKDREKIDFTPYRNWYTINDSLITERLQKDYEDYTKLNLTLSEYFERDIILCTRVDAKRYTVEWQESMTRPIFIFKKRCKFFLAFYIKLTKIVSLNILNIILDSIYYDSIEENISNFRCKNPIRMSWADILELFELPYVEPNNFEELYDSHKVSFKFYKFFTSNRHGRGKKQFCYSGKSLIPGQWVPENPPRYTIMIGAEKWPAETYHLILERFEIHKDFQCNKFPGKCLYTTYHKRTYEEHIASCTDTTKITSVQKCLGNNISVRDEIIKEGNLQNL